MNQDLPKSEFRRNYMQMLTSDLMTICNLDQLKAREVASHISVLFSEKVRLGEDIDLGCLKIKKVTKRPNMVRSHLNSEQQTYYVGERVKWATTVSPAWVRRNSPKWS
jgi:hypothetical protein